jgi:hypothetical protein
MYPFHSIIGDFMSTSAKKASKGKLFLRWTVQRDGSGSTAV